MYKEDLALNNLQWLIDHQTQPNPMYLVYYNRLIGLVGRVFANGPGDLGSIPGRIIPKIQKNGT